MDSESHEHHPLVANNVCLLGLMGSGKSTLGPPLAERLGYTFVDLDREISKDMGRSVREIFEELGEEKFREAERRLLRHFCQRERQVIACGGGVVVTPDNLECLRRQVTVYLEAFPETLARRVGSGESRPLLKGAVSVAQRLGTILKEREPLYKQCAEIILTTEGKDPEALLAELLTQLPRDIAPSAL